MRGAILYFSLTGNTKLACEYIGGKVGNIEFDMFDMREGQVDLSSYDIVGFATYSHEFSIGNYAKDFIKAMTPTNKPAFVFSTYGRNNGATTGILAECVEKKGFQVVLDHALNTPENAPPVIKYEHGHINSPSKEQMYEFDNFIEELSIIGAKLKNKEIIQKKKVVFEKKYKIMATAFEKMSTPFMIKILMGGIKKIETNLCVQCGKCVNICPYNVITMNGYPEFEEKKCQGCFACYNRCPAKAIYTKGYNQIGVYPKPNKALEKKLKI